MNGDLADMRRRLRLTLPTGWFADTAPVLDGVLSGFAAAWVGLYDLLQNVVLQTRVKTATGEFLALAARDYLSDSFLRRSNEADADYRNRLLQAMGRTRATRPAIVAAAGAAGYTIEIFEAAQQGDTGAYNVPNGLAWSTVGGWGSIQMPFESLIVARATSAEFEDELWKNIADATPAGGASWMRISNAS